MNKNICLLVFFACLLTTVASRSEDITVEANTLWYSFILNWWMNQTNYILLGFTVLYCFNLGWFNIFNYNDGGL